MRYEVYKHTSPSGKSYVGISCLGMSYRWKQHLREAKAKRTRNIFHKAIRKYGGDNFNHELLEVMTTEAGAKSAEKLWIKELGTVDPNGYNLTIGGEGSLGFVPTQEMRLKMSKAQTGRKHSDETKEKMRIWHLGRPRSEETKQKLSLANIGKKASEETKAKIAAASTGRKQSRDSIERGAAKRRGRKHSQKTIEKLRAAANNRTPETIEKMRQAAIRRHAK